MIHDALADGRFALRLALAARGDHAAGLVPGDERFRLVAQTQRGLRRAGRRAVELEIAAAHARSLHLDQHLARAGCRVREIADLDLSVAEKYRSSHITPVNQGQTTFSAVFAGLRKNVV